MNRKRLQQLAGILPLHESSARSRIKAKAKARSNVRPYQDEQRIERQLKDEYGRDIEHISTLDLASEGLLSYLYYRPEESGPWETIYYVLVTSRGVYPVDVAVYGDPISRNDALEYVREIGLKSSSREEKFFAEEIHDHVNDWLDEVKYRDSDGDDYEYYDDYHDY
jgi:hypothetical protein